MSERAPQLPDVPPVPVLGIGGLLSIKQQAHYYIPLLHTPGGKKVPIQHRFLAIPQQGLGDFDEMYGELEELFEAAVERVEGPVVLTGHSLGGLFATELALDHPDKIVGVESYAGAHVGIAQMTVAGHALKTFLGNPKNAAELFQDSDMMSAHIDRVANEWPEDTYLSIYTPTHDILIPSPQGLELEVPPGTQTSKVIVHPRIGPKFGIRERTKHIEDIQEVHPIFPAEHVDIVICPEVIQHARHIRKAAAYAIAGEPDPGTRSTVPTELVPLPVAA